MKDHVVQSVAKSPAPCAPRAENDATATGIAVYLANPLAHDVPRTLESIPEIERPFYFNNHSGDFS
ncbi:MAG: hypothetical protein ACYCZ6_01850 [Polaromonas sp.]